MRILLSPTTCAARMSSQKPRRPAHQNKFAFFHNPHSSLTKKIAGIHHVGLCPRCNAQIEWRKKYRKYKPLKEPGRCRGCQEKKVTRAYHTLCSDCAQQKQVCPKCCQPHENTDESSSLKDSEVVTFLNNSNVQERLRRSIFRNWEKGLLRTSDIPKMVERAESGKTVDWHDFAVEVEGGGEGDEEDDDDSAFDDDEDDGDDRKAGGAGAGAGATAGRKVEKQQPLPEDAFLDEEEKIKHALAKLASQARPKQQQKQQQNSSASGGAGADAGAVPAAKSTTTQKQPSSAAASSSSTTSSSTSSASSAAAKSNAAAAQASSTTTSSTSASST